MTQARTGGLEARKGLAAERGVAKRDAVPGALSHRLRPVE